MRRHEELCSREEEQMGRRNLEDLKAWGDDGTGVGVGEKVRVLSEVLGGVCSMGDEKGGRYHRVVRSFEKFLTYVQEIHDVREGDDDDGDLDFIEGLPAEWKEQVFHLERKFKGWKADLCQLGTPNLQNYDQDTTEVQSTLSSVLEKLSDAIERMLEELSMMRNLEDEIVRREEEWIEKMNRNDEDDDDNEERNVAGAIWRRV